MKKIVIFVLKNYTRMFMSLKKFGVFIFFLLFCFGDIYPDWINLINNYTRNDYKAGSQNWQIIQQNNRWMYIANKMGVLEFNGNEWKLYELNNQTDVRSIAVSKDNKRIYLGGGNELGYLEPDLSGKLVYHCISDSLPVELVRFGNIWGIYEVENTIYFCTDQSVLKGTNGNYSLINSPEKIDCSSLINNTMYFGTSAGIYVLAGNTFYLLQGTEKLKDKIIRALLPWDDKVLVATALDGLYVLDDKGVRRMETQADEFFSRNEIFSIAVKNRRIAVGTVLKGAVVLDEKGNVLKYFNESHGLQNNTVLSTYFDKDDNLWLGLDNGIACIELNNPITNLYNSPNFYGAGYAASLHDNMLYLGTNRGLYVTSWPISLSENAPALTFVNGAQGQVWDLVSRDDELFCCLDKGLAVIKNGKIRSFDIRFGGIWSLHPTIDNPAKVWISTYKGFYRMEKENGMWQNPSFIDGFPGSIINFEEQAPGVLFLRNSKVETIKLTLNDSLTRVAGVVSYNKKERLPVNSYIRKIDDEVLWTGPEGIFRIDNNGQFVLDEKWNILLRKNRTDSYLNIYQNDNKIWMLGDRIIGIYDQMGDRLTTSQHSLPLITNFEKIIPVADSLVIICNENGFALWNSTIETIPVKENVMQILKVEITKPVDSLIYVNNFLQNKTVPEISFDHNSICFYFNVVRYPNRSDALFQYSLDGDLWSEPVVSNRKEYSDLSVGKHKFRVKTTLKDGTELMDEYVFVVRSPWYRTGWAYLGYSVLFILMLLCIIYWDHIRMKRKKEQLERIQEKKLQEQEDVYKAETEKKEQEIILLKNEHLELEVKHKNQELANSAINIARKNEALFEVKNDLSKISEDINRNSIADMTALRRKILRLSTKIDDNIIQDDSLKRFEEHFDLVHNNYMHRLAEKYPSLTMSERKMCAFIKMQLSSKEIAPLLNISIRGVETLRYRLRKKIGLSRDESLTSFLNQF